jgi:hypothetical protein
MTWNLLHLVGLRVRRSQIQRNSHHRGIVGLRVHDETHRPDKSEHRYVGGENDARCFVHSDDLGVLEQRRY